LYANFLENFVVDYIRFDFRTSKESFKSLVPDLLFAEKFKKRMLPVNGWEFGTPRPPPPLTIFNNKKYGVSYFLT
jgi:hypothetical protein